MGRPTTEETLRLIKVFYEIAQSEQRIELLRLAEKYADHANDRQKSEPTKDRSP